MFNNIKNLIVIIKTTRKAKKISQHELAEKIGIPQSHLSKIETGNVNMKLAGFIEMARTLELDVMLIPRQDSLMVKNLIAAKGSLRLGDESRPAYTLDEGDSDV